ncbi:MAG: PQQ-dependent sugar dehydrogenase, partial [Ginsengibacter sp.]
MKKESIIISIAALLLLYFIACNSSPSLVNDAISSDSVTIAKGKTTFNQYCSSCHNFRTGGIGPQLGGLTESVSANWIGHFIRNPQKIIESGDERARKLFERYKVAMPSFASFTDDEIDGIIAFLNTHKNPSHLLSKRNLGKEITNALPGSIQPSNLVVGLELVTQFPSSSINGQMPLARITKLDFQPATGDLFVVDLRGKLYKMKNNKPTVYMDMAKLRPKFINEAGLGTGFGSFAFHPAFKNNGLLYTAHTEAPGSGKGDFDYPDSINVTLQWVLTEWKTDDPTADTFSGASRELFRVNMVTVMHGIQEIAFNPLAKPGGKDYGMLYLGIGDGGVVDEGYPFLVHSVEKIWGTVLRINPTGNNSSNGRYGIPSDNPFVNDQNPKTLKEIYAYGFKNPHRITWTKSGQMLVCNIGQEHIESVNLILPGHDYGWPIREGTFLIDTYGDLSKIYPLPANDSIYKITYPVVQYDHTWGWTAISGGYEYSGK